MFSFAAKCRVLRESRSNTEKCVCILVVCTHPARPTTSLYKVIGLPVSPWNTAARPAISSAQSDSSWISGHVFLSCLCKILQSSSAHDDCSHVLVLQVTIMCNHFDSPDRKSEWIELIELKWNIAAGFMFVTSPIKLHMWRTHKSIISTWDVRNTSIWYHDEFYLSQKFFEALLNIWRLRKAFDFLSFFCFDNWYK